MTANFRQQPAPVLQPVAESFSVQRNDKRAIRDPRPDEFDCLFRLWHPVRDIEFARLARYRADASMLGT